MKLLHRLLATAGLAALLGPHPVDAAQKPRLSSQPEVAGFAAEPAAGQLQPQALDRLLAGALVGRPLTVTGLSAALPGIVAAAVTAAPADMPPEQLAALIAQQTVALLIKAGITLDVPTRANLASEIIASLVEAYGQRGLAIDPVTIASATLGHMSRLTARPAPALDRYTAATGGTHDVSDAGGQGNSAY